MTIFSKPRKKSTPRLTYASKDYVEHLRTVHFALLTVSAGLLLLILSVKPYNSGKALLQLDGIIKLKERWSPKWILEQKQQRHPQKLFLFPKSPLYEAYDFSEELTANERPSSYVQIRKGPNPEDSYIPAIIIKLEEKARRSPVVIRLAPPSDADFIWTHRGGSDEQGLATIPNRLDHFARWWHILGTGNHEFIKVSALNHDCRVSSLSESVPVRSCKVFDRDDRAADLKVPLLPDAKPRLAAPTVRAFSVPKGDVYVILTVPGLPQDRLLRMDVVLFYSYRVSQSDVLALFPGAAPGEFATTFPDLNEATRMMQSLELDSISRYLQSNSSTSEVFEAFGLKIPVEQVTSWGTVIILCVGLYLFVYLRGLKRPLEPSDEAWNAGWFAASEALLPRSIFFVTVLVLPATTVILLAKHAIDRPLQEALLQWQWGVVFSKQFVILMRHFRAIPFIILGCLFSLILGYLNWSNRPRVRLEPAASRSQLFE